jgi:hypothetical protein
MAFFVIQTFEDSYVKTEVLETKTRTIKKGHKSLSEEISQLSLI